MAVDVDQDDAGAPPAHGRAIAGKGKGKGKGPAWLTGPHRDEILVISSVVLVLLGWLSLRKPKSGMSADLSTSAGQAAYLGNSGSVAGFSQAAVQGMQDNLNQQRNANAGAFQGLQDMIAKQQAAIDKLSGTVSTVPGTASGLFAPRNTGNYVRYGDGTIAEVQGDGSLLGLNPDQWTSVARSGARFTQVPGDHAPAGMTTTWGNLARINKGA